MEAGFVRVELFCVRGGIYSFISKSQDTELRDDKVFSPKQAMSTGVKETLSRTGPWSKVLQSESLSLATQKGHPSRDLFPHTQSAPDPPWNNLGLLPKHLGLGFEDASRLPQLWNSATAQTQPRRHKHVCTYHGAAVPQGDVAKSSGFPLVSRSCRLCP